MIVSKGTPFVSVGLEKCHLNSLPEPGSQGLSLHSCAALKNAMHADRECRGAKNDGQVTYKGLGPYCGL